MYSEQAVFYPCSLKSLPFQQLPLCSQPMSYQFHFAFLTSTNLKLRFEMCVRLKKSAMTLTCFQSWTLLLYEGGIFAGIKGQSSFEKISVTSSKEMVKNIRLLHSTKKLDFIQLKNLFEKSMWASKRNITSFIYWMIQFLR